MDTPSGTVNCVIPGCGITIPSVRKGAIMSDPKKSLLSENSLGAIAYISCIPAILLLLIPASRRSSYVRYQAWQSIEISATALAIAYALAPALAVGPFVYLGLSWLNLITSASIAYCCGMMALQGVGPRLPVFGPWAEQLANSNPPACRLVAGSLALERNR